MEVTTIMERLKWDLEGQRLYETGTDRGVLYASDNLGKLGAGVAWNGLISVKQAPDGAEPSPLFADNIKYLELTSSENFKGSIDAYTYPDEFNACDGIVEIIPGAYAGQQTRVPFALSYRTLIGNDTAGTDHGYKIHLIWGAKVSPSARDHETVNENPNAVTFSWSFTTTPVQVEGYKPIAYLAVDSTKISAEKLKLIEDTLYGTNLKAAAMPTVQEMLTLLKGPAVPKG